MVWKEILVEEFQDGCLVYGHIWWMIWVMLAISVSPFSCKPFIKCRLKRIYGLEEEVGWRIPKWLFGSWPSLMNEWGDLAISESPCNWSLQSSFWSREYMVWKKMLVEEFQNGCLVRGHLWWVNVVILAILSPHEAGSLSSSFCSREYMVWKKLLVEEFQDGCWVHGHLWWVNGVSLAIYESPSYNKPSIKFLLKRIYGLEKYVG